MASQPRTCKFCDQPEFAPGFTDVPLCEKHLEITLFIGRLEKRGQVVTAEGIQQYMRRWQMPVAITVEEVPALLAQVQAEEVHA